MASSTFLGRSPAYMMVSRNDHPYYASNNSSSYSQVVDAHALYPAAYGGKQQHVALVSPPISASKLPSLTGLLKKMQGEPASPQHSAHSPQSDYSMRAHEQRLSPAGREMTQMPSLRTIISPTMKSAVSTPFYSGFQHERAASPLDTSFPHIAQQQQQPLSYPSRKRSWIETNSSAASYPVKERAVSPVLSVGSSSVSVGPHRSRASKYCKIEGCERVSQRNNLCHSHGGKRLCKEDGCSSKDRGNGYCIKHGGGKICSMDDCEKKARRKGLCTQHFRVCDDGSDSMSSLQYGSM
ncbi:hypothetical protein Gpo141_00010213 [Globisporangium polare]